MVGNTGQNLVWHRSDHSYLHHCRRQNRPTDWLSVQKDTGTHWSTMQKV